MRSSGGKSGQEKATDAVGDARVVVRGEDGVDLGVKGYESMHFSQGSTKVLEGNGWIQITKDNVDSLGF